MPTYEVEEVVLSEERWRAWVEKGRRHDREVARKVRIAFGVLVVVGVVAITVVRSMAH